MFLLILLSFHSCFPFLVFFCSTFWKKFLLFDLLMLLFVFFIFAIISFNFHEFFVFYIFKITNSLYCSIFFHLFENAKKWLRFFFCCSVLNSFYLFVWILLARLELFLRYLVILASLLIIKISCPSVWGFLILCFIVVYFGGLLWGQLVMTVFISFFFGLNRFSWEEPFSILLGWKTWLLEFWN